jgi:signal transduction histidine kinase
MSAGVPLREPPRPRASTQPVAAASPHYACLLEVVQAVNSTLQLQSVLTLILDRAIEVMQAAAGSIMMLDESTGELQVKVARGARAAEIFGRSLKLGEGIAGWVALYGQPLLLIDGEIDTRFHTICQRDDVRDALCVPLQADGAVVGVLSVNNRQGDGRFGEEDLRLLTALGSHVTLAIRNASLYEQTARQRHTMERLLSSLVWAQEEERKRVSLEIHDGPAQTLYAARVRLQAYRALRENDAERAAAEFAEAERGIKETLTEIRRLIFDLRPMSLDEIGLVTALRQYATKYEERHGVRVEVRSRGEERRLPVSLETALYRIVQESLTNIWKHARATRASVIVTFEAGRCGVQVADDGIGFDVAAVRANSQGEHLGIAGIRERAEMIGGTLRIASTPGAGTTLLVSVPTGGVPAAGGQDGELGDSLERPESAPVENH